MVAPTEAVVSGATIVALRGYLVSRYGEQTLREGLQKGDCADLRALLDDQLDCSGTVARSVTANISLWLREQLGTDIRLLFFEFGQYLFSHLVKEAGYEQSIFQVSDTFPGFARSLNQIMLQMFAVLGHTTLGLTFKPHCTNFTTTSFDFGGFIVDKADTPSTVLHLEMHKGIVARAAAQVFALEVQFSSMELRRLASGKELQMTRVTFVASQPGTSPKPELRDSAAPAAGPGQLAQAAPGAKNVVGLEHRPGAMNIVGLDPDSFSEMFPFHFALDMDFRVLQAGSAMRRMIPQLLPGVHVSELLVICLPDMHWDMDYMDVLLENSMHSKVVLTSRDNLNFKGGFHRVPAGCLTPGQPRAWGEALVFMGSPLVTSVQEMQLHNLYLSDFPPCDLTPDHILMADTKHEKTAHRLRLAQEKNLQLESALAQALSSHDAPRPKLDTTSVADIVLRLLDGLILGNEVAAQDVLFAREALLHAEGTNLWSPLHLDPRAMDGDEEVNASLGKLLGAASRRQSVDAPCRPAGPRGSAAGRAIKDGGCRLSFSTAPLAGVPPLTGPPTPGGSQGGVAASTLAPAPGLSPGLERRSPWDTQGLPLDAAAPPAAGARSASTGSPGRQHQQPQQGTGSKPGQSVDVSGAPLPAAPRPSCFQRLMALLKPSRPTPAHAPGPAAVAAEDLAAAQKPSALAVPPAAESDCPAAVEEVITQLLHQPSDQLPAVLSHVGDWHFDSFALERASDGRPLSCLAYFLMHKLDIIRDLNLCESKLQSYLLHIEGGYVEHPYHNRIHAADVLRTLYVVMTKGGVMATIKARSSSCSGASQALQLCTGTDADQSALDPAGMLTVMLAAIVHDYQHRGVNNDFLIRSSDPLALLYNDASPMENHHVAASMSLLREERCAFFPPGSTKARIRQDVIDMVLATDMKQHFALSGTFSSKVATPSPHSQQQHGEGGPPDLGSKAGGRGAPRRDQSATSLSKVTVTEGKPSNRSGPLGNRSGPLSNRSGPLRVSEPQASNWDQSTQGLVLKMALKCSDLGHLTAPTDVHRQWVARLEEELFRQGDQERALGLPVSALMDRTKTGITKSQCGFINVVAHPMFELMVQAFPACTPLVTSLNSNLAFWSEVEEAASQAS